MNKFLVMILLSLTSIANAASVADVQAILGAMKDQGISSTAENQNIAAGLLLNCLPKLSPTEKVAKYAAIAKSAIQMGVLNDARVAPAFAILACKEGARTPKQMTSALLEKYQELEAAGFYNIVSNGALAASMVK